MIQFANSPLPQPDALDDVPVSERAAVSLRMIEAAGALRNAGDTADALKMAESARYLAEQPNGGESLAKALHVMASIKHGLGDYPRSVELALAGLDRVDREVDPQTYMRLNTLAAFGFSMLRSFLDAEYYARRGLDFARASGDFGAIALALNGVAAVREQCRNFAGAIQICEEAIPFAVIANFTELEACLRANLVIYVRHQAVQLIVHDPVNARTLLENAVQTARDAEDFARSRGFHRLLPTCKSDLARILFHLGRLDESLDEALDARNLARLHAQIAHEASTWIVESWVHDGRGNLEEAERCLTEALQCARNATDVNDLIEVWTCMTQHYKKRGMIERALHCSEQLVRQYEQDNIKHQQSVFEAVRLRRGDIETL